MWYIALLENFSHKLRHACCHKYYLNLCRGTFQDFAQLSLADKLSIAVFRLEKQVSAFSLASQPHSCIGLVKTMATDMEHSWTLTDHIDEFILGCNRLAKSNLLIRLLDSLNYRLFFLLELEWDQTRSIFIHTVNENGTRMQKSNVDL